jgi:hypothetical protein
MLHEPPVIPFSACPAHIRELLGPLVPPQHAAVTKDGRLQCQCVASPRKAPSLAGCCGSSLHGDEAS